MPDVIAPRTLSPLASGVGLSVVLVVLFVLCAIVQFIAPGIQVTHAWVGLFTVAPVTSLLAWVEGIFYSVVFGMIGGALFASVHNAIRERGL